MFSIIERHPVLVMLLLAVAMVAALYTAAAVVDLTTALAGTDGTAGLVDAGKRAP